MSDQSQTYFPKEKSLKEHIQHLEKMGLKDEEIKAAYEDAVIQRQEIVIKGMAKAMEEDGYNILVEDIARFLDIDEKHVRFNIIPYVDYIVAP